MKNLLTTTLLVLCSISIAFAQLPTVNSEATTEDFDRYIDKKLEMNFRLSAMEAIELTPEEINAFNPVFNNYVKAKDRLSEKKFELLEEYAEEMEEEEDADDRSEETSDFIEDYWEAEIAEMELKKDYYDILENKIPYEKAVDFFLYEETLENSMKYDIFTPQMPAIIKIEKHKNTRKDLKIAMKEDNISQKEWSRYIDKRLKMDFRAAAIEEMSLTPEEIVVFDPLFKQYMDAKDQKTEKKFNLIDKYSKKISKEKKEKKVAEEVSDFIEDYWEAEIAEMKLKEEYFDKMENQLPYMKVARFFLLEEAVENRMKYDVIIAKMPSLVIIEEKRINTDLDIDMNTDMEVAKKTKQDVNETGPSTMTSNSAMGDGNWNKEGSTSTQENAEKAMMDKSNTAINVEKDANETKLGVTEAGSNVMNGNEKSGHSTMGDNNWNTKRSTSTQENTEKAMITGKTNTVVDNTDVEVVKKTTQDITEQGSNVMNGNEKSGHSTMGDNNWNTKRSTSTQENTEKAMMTGKSNTAVNMEKNAKVSTTPKTAKMVVMPFATELTTFDTWVASHRGQMSLDHGYTHDGLLALSAAIEATAKATNTTIDGWANKKARVANIANQITIDAKSTMHADWVSEAFVILGNAMQNLNDKSTQGQVSLLNLKAKQINPDVLLLKQSNIVYDYFGTANQVVKNIWGYAAKTATTTINTTESAKIASGEE